MEWLRRSSADHKNKIVQETKEMEDDLARYKSENEQNRMQIVRIGEEHEKKIENMKARFQSLVKLRDDENGHLQQALQEVKSENKQLNKDKKTLKENSEKVRIEKEDQIKEIENAIKEKELELTVLSDRIAKAEMLVKKLPDDVLAALRG